MRRLCNVPNTYLLAAILAAFLLAPGIAEGPAGVKVALLVGVTEYDHARLDDLKYAGRDVEELATLLRQNGYARVVVLTGGGRDDRLRPTGENVRRELKGLLDKRTKRDTVLVALSGHGGPSDSAEVTHFCPSDANPAEPKSMLSLSKLYEELDDSGAGLKLLFADVCRAAANGKGAEAEALPKPGRGTAALFACSPGERSFEDDRWRHGAFYFTLLEGLRPATEGGLPADADEDGVVDFDELSRFVRKTVPKRVAEAVTGARQTPYVVSDLTGLVPLVRAADAARPAAPPAAVKPMPKPAAGADEVTAKSIRMTLKRVGPGRFRMGAPVEDAEAYGTERPQHEVDITRPFYLAVHEVTVAQFEAFAKSAGYRTADEVGPRGGYGFDLRTGRFEQAPAFSWRNPGCPQAAEHPVVNVNWEDAEAFCAWLAKQEGKPYRLPTEAEWEYACRSDTATRFCTGDDGNGLRTYANLADESLRARYRESKTATDWDDGFPFTAPVGSFKPNAWGLCDMHGNVWEWCGDFGRDYTRGGMKDPEGRGPGKRVLRGGSWAFGPSYARSALRNRVEPTFRYVDTGFRVALSAP